MYNYVYFMERSVACEIFEPGPPSTSLYPQHVTIDAFRHRIMERGSAADMSSSREGKEAGARPIIPAWYSGTRMDGKVPIYLSTGCSLCVQDMLTYTRGVWAGVPPYSAAVSSLREIKLVFLCGNPCTHTMPDCLTHDWDSVVRGLNVTCVGRPFRLCRECLH